MNLFDEIESILPDLDLLTYLLPDETDDLPSKYNQLFKQYFDLKSIPKKFNEIFADSGWIATDDFSVPFMKKAIDIFEENGIEEAEEYLIQEFDEDYFRKNIKRMQAIWVIDERIQIIELAYDDHKNQRYHASVPVVLSQIDGLIHDIASQSFFEQQNKLDIFKLESQITGLKSKLAEIAKKMNKARNKTANGPLSFPYRNGILHGRDINYNNIAVSTKCFMNLFALRPWALFIQQNEMKRRQGFDFIEIPKLKIGEKLDKKIDWMLKQ